MPDLCFTRDVAVTTPWGVSILRPATTHRRPEAGQMRAFLRSVAPTHLNEVTEGRIEGGDVCLARENLLIIGISGDRTDEDGALAFASRFHDEGWNVVLSPFDPHFLHLDTVFCMVGSETALACVEALDEGFLRTIARAGIKLLPVSYKESRQLGCNVLSVDGHTIIASSATPRVSAMLRSAGYLVHEVDISEVIACGGGVHCLTMPLNRAPSSQGKLSRVA
jgi:N-dimethylarginine dimethylaminohydrolase